jgi:hypothetical protein
MIHPSQWHTRGRGRYLTSLVRRLAKTNTADLIILTGQICDVPFHGEGQMNHSYPQKVCRTLHGHIPGHRRTIRYLAHENEQSLFSGPSGAIYSANDQVGFCERTGRITLFVLCLDSGNTTHFCPCVSLHRDPGPGSTSRTVTGFWHTSDSHHADPLRYMTPLR